MTTAATDNPAPTLPPYERYKPSGVPWLGDVPEHWSVKRLKHVCKQSALYGANEPAASYEDEGVRFLRTTDITDDGDLLTTGAVHLPLDAVEDYLLADGDILLSRSGTVGRAFLYGSASHGPCAYAGYLVRFVPSNHLFPQFLFYFCKSKSFEQWLGGVVISSTIGNVNGQKYANVSMPFPPLSEQRAIAGFLDRATARIDALVARKQRLIDLLKEKRAAVISHAVTKGLNPHAPTKPSGIDWLGDIPQHWESKRIKHLLHRIIDTEHKTAPFYPDGDYMVVRTTNVRNGRLVMDDAKFTDEAGYREWTRRGVPEPGDVIFTREAPAGEACPVPRDRLVCLGQRTVLFRVDSNQLNDRFAVYALYGGLADEFIKVLSQGTTVAHFNMSDIGNIPLLTPPLREQEHIADHLDQWTSFYDDTIAKVQSAIDNLREYRTALISAAVTGKIDVRAASPVSVDEADGS